MSTTVDQRVVKMEFDNKQFESGIQTSISSLERLNQSLEFKNMSNSISQISGPVTKISKNFSALGVAGITAMTRITNAAINAGSKVLKALTIDPIISGFNEYETQINATQTILANTSKEGATIKDVNAALDELNRYADLTIYNFTEMTKNIGTFTAAGVKLDTSVNAIQGIANLAAVSGSTSQQASTAMYQLSQALAAGTVKLQDWNSVVNAGMGGQKFQDALTMTAKVHGVAIDKMIKEEGSFRETLSKGWLTSDILTETLQHFTEFTDEYNEKTLAAQGYTKAQIEEIKQLGITATEAATKVKTFSQLWDVLKEAAQSGWAQSWRLIIGDFEQAKTTLTEFSDTLTEVINNSSARRNAVLTEGLTSGFNQFVTEAGIDFETFSKSVQKAAKDYGVAIDEMIDDDGSFEETLHRGWVTSDILKKSLNNTTESLSKMSEKQLKASGYTTEQVESLKAFNKEVQNGAVNIDEWTSKMGMVSGRENLMESLLNIFKAVMAIAKPVREAFENIFPPMTGEQLYNITEKIREFTEKLIISENTANKIRGAIEGILTAIKPFFVGLKVGVHTISTFLGAIVPPLLNAFITISGYLGVAYTKIGNLINVSKLLELEGEVINSIIQMSSTYVAKLSDLVGYFIEKLTGVDVGNFEEVSAVINKVFQQLEKLKSSIVEVAEAAVEGNIESSATANTIKNKLGKAIDSVNDKYRTFSKETKIVIDGLVRFAKKVKKIFAPAAQVIKDTFEGITITDLFSTGMLTGIFLTLRKFGKEVGSIKDSVIDVLDSTRSALETYQSSLKAKTLVSIAISVGILAASLIALSTINIEQVASGLLALSVLLVEVMGIMKLITSEKFEFDAKKFKKVSTVALAMGLLATSFLILAKAMGELSVFQSWDSTWPALTAMIALMGGLTGAAVLLSKFGADNDIIKSAIGLLLFATAIKSLARSMQKFADMDPKKLKKGLIILAALLGEISTFIFLTDLAAAKDAEKTIIGIATSMILMAAAIDMFGKMDPKVLEQGMAVLAAIMFGLAVTLKAVDNLKISGGASTIVALAAAMTMLLAPIYIFGRMDTQTIAKGLTTVGLALIAFGGAIALMKLGSGALKGTAPSILALALAMTMISIPLKLLGSMSLKQIAAGLSAMTLSLAALVGLSVLLQGAAIALTNFAKAILLIGVGALATAAAIAAIAFALTTLATLGAVGVASILAAFAGLIAGFIAMAPLIETALVTLVNLVLNVIKRTGPKLIEAVITLMDALLESIANHAESIILSLINIVIAIFKALIKIISKYFGPLFNSGVEAISNFIKGIASKIKDLVSKGKEAVGNFVKGIKNRIGEVIQIGKDTIAGFIQGIKDKIGDLANAVKGVGNTVINKLKGVLGIHSPSKETQELAKYTIEGYIKGLKDNEAALGRTVEEVFTTRVVEELTNGLAEVMSTLSYGEKAIQKYVLAYGDLTDTVKANQSFAAAKKAVEDYTTSLYLNSDAYEENVANVEALEKEQASLQKQIEKYSKKTDEDSKEKVKSLKSDLKTVKNELKTAKKEITEGTKEFIANQEAAYNDLANSISESIKSSIDPMSVSLDTQINLFEKFNDEAEELLASDIISNMESQVAGISKWNENLEALVDKGFAKGLIEQIKSMGPTASNYIQAFMTMTNEQMVKANEVFEQSSQLTASTLLRNFQESLDAAEEWSDNLAILATRGLAKGMIEQLGNAGVSSAEYVEAFMSMTASQISEFNSKYADYLELPTNIASEVMSSFSFAGTDLAASLADSLNQLASPESEQNQQLMANMETTGAQMVESAKTGAESKQSDAVLSAVSIGKAVYTGFETYISTSPGKTLGSQMCSGLALGLQEGKSSVIAAAVSTAVAAYTAACAVLDINSPSKKFEGIGRFADMGLARGFKRYSYLAENEADSLGKKSITGLKGALKNIARVVDSDIDPTPVIRPVIDLDDLESGVDSMNGMLANKTLNVGAIRAKANAISAGMNVSQDSSAQPQNGQNGNSYSFTQYNYSPKALSQVDIYRQTKNQFSAMKGALKGI